jgi:hypothetical protein
VKERMGEKEDRKGKTEKGVWKPENGRGESECV